MSFLEEGLDKTTGLCVGLTSFAFGLPAGASEFAVGAAGLIGFVLGEKKKFGPECERVREKIQKKILNTYKKKITGSDGNWQADADLIAADTSLQECLEKCYLDRSDLAKAAVSAEGFVEKAVENILAQLATNYPDQFGVKRQTDLYLNYARDVVSVGIEEAYSNSAYYKSIESELGWEKAHAIGQIREDVPVIKANTSETLIIVNELRNDQKLNKEYEPIISRLRESHAAKECELTYLLSIILEKHIPRENIQTELESAYQRLKELRDNFGDVTSLANEAPEIAPLLKEADEALQAGDGFSLDKAEETLKKADERYEEIISTRDEQVKNDKLNRARILIKRAKIAEVKFDYKAAEGFYREELALQIDVNGEEHEDTATSYNNLARNLDDQGKYSDAEPLHRMALNIFECNFGEEHNITAISYNNLGLNLDAQDRYKEAELLFCKALKIRQKTLGEEHRDAAIGYDGVACCLDAQGRYDEAEPLYHKALEIRKRVLDKIHPEIATSYNNVAYNLNIQGKHVDAEPFYRKAIKIFNLSCGEQNSSTAISYNNLARNLDVQQRYKEAEPFYRKAIKIYEHVLIEGHPFTTKCYFRFANNLEAQGKHEEAEEIRKKIEK